MDDIIKKRREEAARSIAKQVDPAAGDYFRRALERAALLGMEWQEQQK